ncbi:MAG: cardiolipin synthase [Rhodoblastus sp.]
MTALSIATLLEIAHILVVFSLGARVIMRNLEPGVTLAWLLLIAVFPLFGALIYLLGGERPLGSRRASRIRALRAPLNQCFMRLAREAGADPSKLRPEQRRLAAIATRPTALPLLESGKIDIISGGQPIIRAIIADIENAQESCSMAFYIWNAGGVADEAADALKRAAARGVQCRLLLDAVGSGDFLRTDQVEQLRDAGVEVVVALPVGIVRALFVRVDLRLHRKIVVIDQKIAYTGSMNMVDPYYFKRNAGVGEWVDAMLRFTGPPVAALDAVFLESWAAEPLTPLQPDEIAIAGRAQPRPEPASSARCCVITPSGPENPVDSVRRLVVNAIYEAREEIVVTTPYFVPDVPVLEALESAAIRGVAVTLILPARNDSKLVRYASRSYFDSLLRAGVRILRFEDGLLHTKSLTTDGRTTIFGTFNLDIRSMRLNFEVAALIFDEETTRAVRALQASYEMRSHAVDLARWRERPARERFLESALRIASPLL